MIEEIYQNKRKKERNGGIGKLRSKSKYTLGQIHPCLRAAEVILFPSYASNATDVLTVHLKEGIVEMRLKRKLVQAAMVGSTQLSLLV